MITVMNRIPVNPAYSDAFEARFKNRASSVDKMPGFVAYRLLRPTADGAPYVVMTTWASREHFTAWTESAEFQQGHAQSGRLPQEAYLGRPTLEIHEVIQESLAGAVVK
jgi:heme-degrading monooxygenase HmoA